MPTDNLDHDFGAVAAQFRDKIAAETTEDALTYEQLDDRVDEAAAGLRDQGIAPGDALGIAIVDGLSFMTVLFAAWRIGATAVPLDAWAKTAEVDIFARRFQLRAIVTDRTAFGSTICAIHMVGALRDRTAGPTDMADSFPSTGPALIALTSGTTGRPRGAALSFEQLSARNKVHVENFVIGPDDRFLATLPVQFGAMRAYVLGRLLSGATVVFHPTIFSPRQIAESIRRLRVTSVFLVPSVVRSLLALWDGDGPLFPDLKRLDCGGDFLQPDEKRAAVRQLTAGFNESYASAAGGVISALDSADIEVHAESVGRPVPQVQVEIVDESDRPLPSGEVGRLRFLSPGNATRFVGDDKIDDEQSDAVDESWAYPGDFAMLDEEGFLHLRGRTADLIIRGGANIYPAEIEEVLGRHPDVAEVCAVGWPSKSLGEEIALFVVAAGQADRSKIRSYCRSHLAPQKQPRDVFFVESLPHSAGGKILRRELVATLSAIE
jgi:long-chain acyl-CoA synthetase